MGGAIAICAKNGTAEPIKELWREVGCLEPTPSMEAVGYPPHFTFVICQSPDVQQLQDAANATFKDVGPLRITFDKIKVFETSPLVLWASPVNSDTLLKLHKTIHGGMESIECDEHYRLDSWIPHCTLGTQISNANREAAMALCDRKIEPFDVIFDHMDYISFPPIRVENRLELHKSLDV